MEKLKHIYKVGRLPAREETIPHEVLTVSGAHSCPRALKQKLRFEILKFPSARWKGSFPLRRPYPGHRVSFIRAKYKQNKGKNKTEIT